MMNSRAAISTTTTTTISTTTKKQNENTNINTTNINNNNKFNDNSNSPKLNSNSIINSSNNSSLSSNLVSSNNSRGKLELETSNHQVEDVEMISQNGVETTDSIDKSLNETNKESNNGLSSLLSNINNNSIVASQRNVNGINQNRQPTTLIIEGGLNGLQFQLKPETTTNRQITLKVVPIGNNGTNTSVASILNSQTNDSSTHQSTNPLNNNVCTAKTLILNGSSSFNITSSTTKQLSGSISTDHNNNNINNNNNNKKENLILHKLNANMELNSLNDFNNQQHQQNSTNTMPPTPSPPTTTTTVNLSESNQGVFFMMPSPIELVKSSTGNLNSINQLKLKTPSATSPTNNKIFSPTSIGKSIDLNGIGSITPPHQQQQPTTTIMTLTSPLSSSSNSSPTNTNKVVRDERRRANHNEVERRRRDNINKWIVELSKVIPDCSTDQSKHGQVRHNLKSKGGILEKTVQYLSDIKQANKQLGEHIQSLQKLKEENEYLRKENELYKKENQFFRSKFSVNDSELLNKMIAEFNPSGTPISNSNACASTSSFSSSSSSSSSSSTSCS